MKNTVRHSNTPDSATKRVFITGGASGLGLALARRYRQAGWQVCIGDVDAVRLKQVLSQYSDLSGLSCDVTRESSLTGVRRWLEQHWDGVDLVINNAGVAAMGPIDQMSIGTWNWVLDINLMGVVRGCKVFSPLFKRQGHGQFINIASAAGLFNPALAAAYNASKAGVISLSETLHHELSRDNIQTMVVCPSFFKTNLALGQRSTDEKMAARTTRLVNESNMTPEQVADAIVQAAAMGQFMLVMPDDAHQQWLNKQQGTEACGVPASCIDNGAQA
jgi:NAD(P)-dependent dehydrogenase (short-subunit alcohol dehydrogenase family)